MVVSDPFGLPSSNEVRDAYNAQHGRALIRDRPRFYRMVARRILRHLEPTRRGEACLLDCACGGGLLFREVLRAAPGVLRAHHGLEISDTALREARRTSPLACLTLGQGEKLPYRDRAFDVVACLGSLEHFIDPRAGARELARVCRSDGKVWLLLPNSYYSGDLWRVIRTGYGPTHHQIVERFATVNEWRDLLESSGLRVEDVTPYNRFKWWKRLLPRNLAYHFLYRARSEI